MGPPTLLPIGKGGFWPSWGLFFLVRSAEISLILTLTPQNPPGGGNSRQQSPPGQIQTGLEPGAQTMCCFMCRDFQLSLILQQTSQLSPWDVKANLARFDLPEHMGPAGVVRSCRHATAIVQALDRQPPVPLQQSGIFHHDKPACAGPDGFPWLEGKRSTVGHFPRPSVRRALQRGAVARLLRLRGQRYEAAVQLLQALKEASLLLPPGHEHCVDLREALGKAALENDSQECASPQSLC